MARALKIGLIILVAFIIGVLGYLIVKNVVNKNVGIDSSITKENEKKDSTILDSDKVLVIYFSQSGNTKKLAKIISDSVGGDLVRIETVQTYPTIYEELAEFAKNEKDNNIKPELKNLGIDLNKYDTIFIGYPIWWYQMPMPMYTFFDNYNFDGKTIIPFNTHEGSGDGGTYDDIKKLEPNAKVLEGLPIRGADMANDQREKVDNWLSNLEFNK